MDHINEAEKYVAEAKDKGSDLFVGIAIAEALIAIAEKLEKFSASVDDKREGIRIVSHKPEW